MPTSWTDFIPKTVLGMTAKAVLDEVRPGRVFNKERDRAQDALSDAEVNKLLNFGLSVDLLVLAACQQRRTSSKSSSDVSRMCESLKHDANWLLERARELEEKHGLDKAENVLANLQEVVKHLDEPKSSQNSCVDFNWNLQSVSDAFYKLLSASGDATEKFHTRDDKDMHERDGHLEPIVWLQTSMLLATESFVQRSLRTAGERRQDPAALVESILGVSLPTAADALNLIKACLPIMFAKDELSRAKELFEKNDMNPSEWVWPTDVADKKNRCDSYLWGDWGERKSSGEAGEFSRGKTLALAMAVVGGAKRVAETELSDGVEFEMAQKLQEAATELEYVAGELLAQLTPERSQECLKTKYGREALRRAALNKCISFIDRPRVSRFTSRLWYGQLLEFSYKGVLRLPIQDLTRAAIPAAVMLSVVMIANIVLFLASIILEPTEVRELVLDDIRVLLGRGPERPGLLGTKWRLLDPSESVGDSQGQEETVPAELLQKLQDKSARGEALEFEEEELKKLELKPLKPGSYVKPDKKWLTENEQCETSYFRCSRYDTNLNFLFGRDGFFLSRHRSPVTGDTLFATLLFFPWGKRRFERDFLDGQEIRPDAFIITDVPMVKFTIGMAFDVILLFVLVILPIDLNQAVEAHWATKWVALWVVLSLGHELHELWDVRAQFTSLQAFYVVCLDFQRVGKLISLGLSCAALLIVLVGTYPAMSMTTDDHSEDERFSTAMTHSLSVVLAGRSPREMLAAALTISITATGLRLLTLLSATGPLVSMFFRMLKDCFEYGLLQILFIIAFAVAFHVLLHDGIGEECVDFYEVPTSLYSPNIIYRGVSLLGLVLGSHDADMGCLQRTRFWFMAPALMMTYMFLSSILLLNMLIAMMSKTFDLIHTNHQADYNRLFLQLVLRYSDAHLVPAPLNVLGGPAQIVSWFKRERYLDVWRTLSEHGRWLMGLLLFLVLTCFPFLLDLAEDMHAVPEVLASWLMDGWRAVCIVLAALLLILPFLLLLGVVIFVLLLPFGMAFVMLYRCCTQDSRREQQETTLKAAQSPFRDLKDFLKKVRDNVAMRLGRKSAEDTEAFQRTVHQQLEDVKEQQKLLTQGLGHSPLSSARLGSESSESSTCSCDATSSRSGSNGGSGAKGKEGLAAAGCASYFVQACKHQAAQAASRRAAAALH